MTQQDTTIYDLGFGKALTRNTKVVGLGESSSSSSLALLPNSVLSAVNPSTIQSGSLVSNLEQNAGVLFNGKTSFSDTTTGYRLGIDTDDNEFKFFIGSSVSSMDWNVTTADTLTINGIGIVSPTISFGKTSFTDSTNAGYYISSAGVYIGAASDATAFKYTVATGSFDFIGTVSSRSTATLATAINSSGNLITNVINAQLDTSSKKILSDFNFGTADFAGAVNAGNVTWNTTTGAITGGSGVLIYRGGIVGANAGVATFTIDSTTGAATFAGALSAPTGNIGGFTIAATTLSATNLTITSGTSNVANISVGTGANLSGLNAGNAGTDIAGWAGTTYANRAAAPFRWNLQGDVTMTSATISGVLVSTQGTFGGDGSDGALSISSGTTTISAGSAAYLVKNYSSISITGTGSLAFSNPNTNGTIVNIKSQGSVTATTSGVAFDVSGMGAVGGNGGSSQSAGTSGLGTTTSSIGGSIGTDATGGGSQGTGGAGGTAVTFILHIYGKVIRVTPGAGGGGGGDDQGATILGAAGGRGGGGLIIEAATTWNFTTGSISCAGSAGSTGGTGANPNGGGGGGGGGAGGTIAVMYKTLTADSGTYTIAGGAGGPGGAGNNNEASGGGGGGGGNRAAGGAGGNGTASGSAGSGTTGGAGGDSGVDSGGGGGGGGASGDQYTVLNTEFA